MKLTKLALILFSFFALHSFDPLQVQANATLNVKGTLDSVDNEQVIIRKGSSLYYIQKKSVSAKDYSKLRQLEKQISLNVPIESIQVRKDPRAEYKKRKPASAGE